MHFLVGVYCVVCLGVPHCVEMGIKGSFKNLKASVVGRKALALEDNFDKD